MEYSIKDLSEITGITTRTLRYYDEIDILKPAKISDSGYRIYRATSSNGKYTYIGSTSSKVNTYTDKRLTRNKTYYYKIRAYKNLNNEKLYGDYSKVLKAKTK